jgi:hypothetical protein
MVKTGLTTHAKARLRQRCTMEPGDLKQILNSNKCIFLEFEGSTSVAHKLFYSKGDDTCFVAIQNVSDGAVITILPWRMWSNGPLISSRSLEHAKKIILAPQKEKPERLPQPMPKKKLKRSIGVRKIRIEDLPIRAAQKPVVGIEDIVVCGADDYKFYVVLTKVSGEQRTAYLARFGSWDATNPAASRQAERLLRAQMRQVMEKGEVPISIQMQLGKDLLPVDELLSRLV